MRNAIEIYVMICASAIPIAIAFSVCNLIVSTFLTMAFKGKVIIG